jgi:KDO2-lipid IV(A) lauroyltransferase
MRVAHAVVCRLPWPVGRGLAWVGGTAAYYLVRRERRFAVENLTHAFGEERSPAEIRVLAREVFRHVAAGVIDWLILRRWSPEKLRKRFPEVCEQFREMARKAEASGAGVVAVTAHCGCWELSAFFANQFTPGRFAALAKRTYFEKYNDFITRLRTERGFEIIYTDDSPRKMMRTLKEGKILSLLSDQDLRTNSGIFVDFFGRPAYTVTFPVQLARKVGVKMAVCLLLREGKSFRFAFEDPYELPQTGNKEADVLEGTRIWTRKLEEYIRKYPQQWIWFHRRWRTRPGQGRGRRVRDWSAAGENIDGV